MLDIKFIKENADLVREGAKKKHIDFDVTALLAIDSKRIEALSLVESLRAEQNVVSDAIMHITDTAERTAVIEKMRTLKEHLREKEEELRTVMKVWQELMLKVPNIPDMSVPEGESDNDNKEVKVWGEKPVFAFEPKDHIALMESLDMVDFERGTKVSGFRGYFLKNDGARLSMAIWNYALDFFTARGLDPMIVPSLVRKESFIGTGYLPQSEEDLYKVSDNDYLSGTGEVATMGYHMDEVLDADALPKKYLAFSPCFRSEAGSHSKDVKGLIRVHEFFKLEQVILCEANHETSVRFHEEINGNTEAFIESLGIPYHTVVNCGGDLGLGQVKKYDIELWVPKEGTYREISSASYFHDFQTRRLNTRYKDADGKLRYAHSLNCTAIPTPRILVSLVENFQQADGTIKVPDVLVKYLGKEFLGKK